MTEYEARQRMRYNERQIRRWKREGVALNAAGLDSSEAAAKVSAWQARQQDFIDQTGFKRDYARETVPKNAVAISEKSATIEAIETEGGIAVHDIGRIDITKYQRVSDNITTDEVIITDERMQHIRDNHPGAYERIAPYLETALSEPDYILEDKHPNSALVLKLIEDNDLRLQIILRLHTSQDQEGYKNSIISAWDISQERWRNYIKNKKVLYKRE